MNRLEVLHIGKRNANNYLAQSRIHKAQVLIIQRNTFHILKKLSVVPQCTLRYCQLMIICGTITSKSQLQECRTLVPFGFIQTYSLFFFSFFLLYTVLDVAIFAAIISYSFFRLWLSHIAACHYPLLLSLTIFFVFVAIHNCQLSTMNSHMQQSSMTIRKVWIETMRLWMVKQSSTKTMDSQEK